MSLPSQPCSLSPSPKLLINSSQVTSNQPLAIRDSAMVQTQTKPARVTRQRLRSGMTLIELLVAVAILVIIAAILVPQLRFASADRNIREASRVVASLFASASQRAINDGEAGVVIERNPNIVDEATGHVYAGTSMFMLRQVPRYIGEDTTDQAELVRTSSANFSDPAPGNRPDVFQINRNSVDIFITMPLEQEELGIIRVGDQISFNDQGSVRYFITKTDFTVDEQTDIVDGIRKLRLRIVAASDFLSDSFPPNAAITEDPNVPDSSRLVIGAAGAAGSFTVYRQPRKLVSSRLDMPKGYLVDLRLSGEVDANSGSGMLFDLDDRSVGTPAVPNSITYLFNSRGSIDRFFYSALDRDGNYQRLFKIPAHPAYLMVREYSTDDGGETTNSVMGSDRTMWVTVDHVTGAANVVSGVAVDMAGDFQENINEARILSSRGQQAAQ